MSKPRRDTGWLRTRTTRRHDANMAAFQADADRRMAINDAGERVTASESNRAAALRLLLDLMGEPEVRDCMAAAISRRNGQRLSVSPVSSVSNGIG